MEKIASIIEKKIISDISSGKLQSGQQLDEVSLAQQFNVSRTPVREVIATLVAQKILVNKPGERGIWVASYSKEELSQMFETMQEIEIICAKLAANRMTLLHKSKIIEAQKKCESAAEQNDREDFLRANEKFHLTIYEATGNKFVYEIASNFRYRTDPFRSKSFRTKEDLMQSIEAHRLIVNSLFKGGGVEVENEIMERMSSSYLKILSFDQ